MLVLGSGLALAQTRLTIARPTDPVSIAPQLEPTAPGDGLRDALDPRTAQR